MADDKNLDKKSDDNEPELVIVDQPITDAGDDKDKSRKARDARMDDDDDDGHRDARMDDPGEHLRETQEQKRERRRKERHEERDRRRREDARKDSAIRALEENNRRMQTELDTLKQRSVAGQVGAIEAQMNDALRIVQEGERELRDAVERADGNATVMAQRKVNHGTHKYRELEALKTRAAQQTTQPQRQDNGRDAPAPMDPEVRRYVRRFQKDHPWYDGRGDDQDSAIVLTIDAKLTDEGYDPADQEYWDELRDRIERALPHRFDGDDDDDSDDRRPARRANGNGDGRRRGPPVRGNGGGSLRRNEVYINPDRRAALQAAGYWGDEEKMKRLAKRYQQYDRENSK